MRNGEKREKKEREEEGREMSKRVLEIPFLKEKEEKEEEEGWNKFSYFSEDYSKLERSTLGEKKEKEKREKEERNLLKKLHKGLKAEPLLGERKSLKKKKGRKERNKAVQKTSGKNWFNLPTTPLTPQVETDLLLLKQRNNFFQDKFYKSNSSGKKDSPFPPFFQTGTIIDNPLDFYSSRIPQKKRKQTLADEILQDTKIKASTQAKYNKLQARLERMKNSKRKYFSMKKKRKLEK